MKRSGLLILTMSLAAACAESPDVPIYGATEGGPAIALSNADGQSPYSGVGRLRARAQCTAALLDTAREAGAPAYILTNGHCATTFGSNEVAVNQAAPSNYRVTFGVFKDTPLGHREIAVRRIAFSTMKGTDLAILELDASLDELRRAGVRPLRLARSETAEDEPVVIVGAPAAGVAAPDLQLSACRSDRSVPVMLEYQWHWFAFERNRCAGIGPGSSGSPVISRRTSEIVAVLNTTTAGGDSIADCWLDRPCEATGIAGSSRPATNYAAPIVDVQSCFDDHGDFDITRAACTLDQGLQLAPAPAWLGYVNPNLDAPVLGPPRRQWDVRLSGPFARYKTLVTPAGGLDACRDPGAYAPARPLASATIVDEPLPRTEGRYALCILGEDGAAGGQPPSHPNVVTVTIDTTPPSGPAPFTVREGAGAWSVAWGSNPPEQGGVLYKSGPSPETRCGEAAGYRLALIAFTSLPFASIEQRLCVIGLDSALNQSAPVERLLPPR